MEKYDIQDIIYNEGEKNRQASGHVHSKPADVHEARHGEDLSRILHVKKKKKKESEKKSIEREGSNTTDARSRAIIIDPPPSDIETGSISPSRSR